MAEKPRIRLFASTAPGLAPLAASELAALGIRGKVDAAGVEWSGTLAQLYDANLRLRTASRVLIRIAEFEARAFWELEKRARSIPWEAYVPPGVAAELHVSSSRSKLYHEGAIEARLREAIEARVGGQTATHAPPPQKPTQLFVVRVHRDRFTISADGSGELLHRRGYRQATAKAPLRETLAAAMLLASGWDRRSPLLDPFCGAGTIPIEAALLARRIAPGLAAADRSPRAFAFQRWPNFDAGLWDDVVSRAREEALPDAPAPILGSDRNGGAIRAATANASRAGADDDVAFDTRPLSAVAPPPGPGWMVTNPPYGVRVGERKALRNLYAALGNVARDRLPGWTVALLSADRRLEAETGLPLTEALRTQNGGIAVRVAVGRVPEGPAA